MTTKVILLKADVPCNEWIITKEAMEKMDLPKIVPVTIDFSSEASQIVGTATITYDGDGNLIAEMNQALAGQFNTDKQTFIKGTKQLNNPKIMSVSFVNDHGQDETIKNEK